MCSVAETIPAIRAVIFPENRGRTPLDLLLERPPALKYRRAWSYNHQLLEAIIQRYEAIILCDRGHVGLGFSKLFAEIN
ncbi:hypothetical protein EV292_106233 [Sphingomonas sp. BK235]|nr:hypothetical protein EV292_106233 [Sphingomonas sp. BK235]